MKKWKLLFVILFSAAHAQACTTFLFTHNGHHYFGRNYDWITGNGSLIVNPRSLQKQSLETKTGKQTEWISRYGSITFNQYGREFPTGGMNEEGLVVELMWLDETRYPDADDRPAMQVLQWIQYQLDCHKTVSEVIASDAYLRITTDGTPLHYLVADASGKAATIEFLNGKMVIHQNENLPYPVLANSTYDHSMASFQNDPNRKGDHSLSRFSTACRMLESGRDKLPEGRDPVAYSFDILRAVQQGDYTKWSIVYDISSRKVEFISRPNGVRRSFSFSSFDFRCRENPLAYALSNKGGGRIDGAFLPMSFEQNEALVKKSARETEQVIRFEEASIQAVTSFYRKPSCQE